VSAPGRYVIVGHSLGGVVSLVASAADDCRPLGTLVIDSRVQDADTWAAAGPASRMRDVPHRHYASETEAAEHFRLVPEQPLPPPEIVREIVGHSIRKTPKGQWTWKFDPHVFSRPRPHPDEFATHVLHRITAPTA